MQDLLTALGLVFVLEGLVLALFPRYVERMTEMLSQIPPDTRRWIGLLAIASGVALVWAVR
ncbi:MAG: DUF2065 domain-containing protein [Limibacillus sp.]|jgi:uncharacterized protein